MKKTYFLLVFILTGFYCTQIFSQSANPNDPNEFQYIFIDAGLNHSVALKCNGEVNTWGDNAFGQLGNDDAPTDSNEPEIVSGPGGVDELKGIIAVAAGDNHTLALRNDGTVWTWGRNANGQLGDGTTNQRDFPVQVQGIGGVGNLTGVVAIAAGENHSLAILDDGRAVAWGLNSCGQLADGSTTQRNFPVEMTGIDLGTTAYAVAGGEEHSYLLQSDGRVKSCGCDSSGQLGDDGNSGMGETSTLGYVNIDQPGTTPLENIIAIASGPIHGLALDSSGRLWSWGLQSMGVSNNALGRTTNVPGSKFAGQVDDIDNAIAVAAGTHTSYALIDDYTIMVFGDDDFGQLGLGAGDQSTITPTALLGLSDVRAIGSRGSHVLVLLDDDTIESFGNNSQGQLGIGVTGGTQQSPTLVTNFDMGTIYADAGPDQSYCSGDSVQIGGEVADYANYMYQWIPSTGLTGGAFATTQPDTLAQPFSVISTATYTEVNYVLIKTYRDFTIDVCYETDTCLVTVRGTAVANFASNAPVCTGEPVDFVNTGSSGEGVEYLWSFGAGAIYPAGMDTVENPTGIIYNTHGPKVISFTVTDSVCGGENTFVDGITIREQPIASFNYNPNINICAGTLIDFTNTGSSGSTWSYTWDFGTDAVPSTSNAENPNGIRYTSSGNKTVTLTISNGNCTETYSELIVIGNTPVADFTHNSSYCTDDVVDFENTGTTGASYSWDFGAGATPATSTDENPAAIVYNTPGIKTVVLTATIGACSDVITKTINIAETPEPSFTHNAPQCQGTDINFNYTGTSGTNWTYLWDFGENATPNSSSQQSPQEINYAAHGTKTVQLTVSNGNCVEHTSQTIDILETPTADFTHNSSYCTDDIVDFENTGTTGATYSWSFGAGATPATSTDEDPAGIVYNTPGIKTVELTTTLGTCVDIVTKTINIAKTPEPSFTHNAPQCQGTDINFNYTGTTGTNWTYLWDFGENATPSSSSQQSPQEINYAAHGTKTVQLTVSNGNCVEHTSQTIDILETPTADFTHNSSYCTDDIVDFENTGTTGATYAWNFGADATPATSTDEDPAGIVYDTPGIKTVVLTTTLGTCVDIVTKTINIAETPEPSFTHNAPQCQGTDINFNYTGTTGTNWTYLWDFGENATPNSSSQQSPQEINFAAHGTKTVQLTVSNGNCVEHTSQTIDILETPTADFTHNSSYCTDDIVDFENTGTTAANYSWNFGAGATPATSTDENPAGIVYDTPGIKTVVLTTTLGTCVDIVTKTINIAETPEPSFTHNAPQCQGTDINFNYTGTSGTNWTYLWDFGENATPNSSSQQSPQEINFAAHGTKTVQLTVANGNCVEHTSQTIDILETPTADFTSISTYCSRDTVNFENTGTTGADYLWHFGMDANPQTSSLENPNAIIYDTHGIKSVMLITTLGTCSDSITKTINITETPQPAFTHNATQCEGVSVNFNYTGTEGSDWMFVWDFGDGAQPSSSSQQNPQSILYSVGGERTVLLTVTNGMCSEKFSSEISINSLPDAIAGPDTTICANTSVQIGGEHVDGYTYNWHDPDGSLNNTTISNPTAQPTANITNYQLLVTDTNGCQNRDTVTVIMMNSAFVNAGPDVRICRYDSVQIGMGMIEWQTYEWTPHEGISNPFIANPVVSPDSTTIYTVSVQYADCEIITDDVEVIVHQLPLANAGDDQTITLGASAQLIATGGVQYSWTPEETLNNPGIYNPVANPLETTEYTVEVIDIYGCINSDYLTIYVIEPSFWIPNSFTPNGDGLNDILYVRGTGITKFEFKIFNRWGETVFYSQNLEHGWDGTRLNTEEQMPQGAYVYSISGVDSKGDKIQESGVINLIR